MSSRNLKLAVLTASFLGAVPGVLLATVVFCSATNLMLGELTGTLAIPYGKTSNRLSGNSFSP